MKYDSKVSSLQEWDDIKLMTVDGIHGIFTSYEMRTGQNGPSKKEALVHMDQKFHEILPWTS